MSAASTQEGNAVAEYGYVIVGGGTAGCVLAARLSEDAGARVLLLEAGSAERTRAMTVPDAWPELLGSDADWAEVTTGQADAGPVSYPGAGPWAGLGRSTPWRMCAGTGRADASVFPVIPNAHPDATVLAVAGKAAELISGGPAGLGTAG